MKKNKKEVATFATENFSAFNEAIKHKLANQKAELEHLDEAGEASRARIYDIVLGSGAEQLYYRDQDIKHHEAQAACYDNAAEERHRQAGALATAGAIDYKQNAAVYHDLAVEEMAAHEARQPGLHIEVDQAESLAEPIIVRPV